jgi:hypothetical protein
MPNFGYLREPKFQKKLLPIRYLHNTRDQRRRVFDNRSSSVHIRRVTTMFILDKFPRLDLEIVVGNVTRVGGIDLDRNIWDKTWSYIIYAFTRSGNRVTGLKKIEDSGDTKFDTKQDAAEEAAILADRIFTAGIASQQIPYTF